LFWRNL
jgi:putative methionine-R-sulfoxide reductase with GAF domain